MILGAAQIRSLLLFPLFRWRRRTEGDATANPPTRQVAACHGALLSFSHPLGVCLDTTMSSPWWSVGLWPPSESSREQYVDQLANNLSNETYASQAYGVLGEEDAYENAKRIEQKCFEIGDEHFKQHADDGRSALRLYTKEACGMVTQVLKKVPKTAKRKFHWVEQTIDILNKIKESHGGTVLRQVPTKIVKHGPGHNREPDDAKGIASSLTDSINSCKRICLNNRSSGIGDANVDVARGSTQWMMERLEYVLTKINGNFISDEGVDEVKKILEVVGLTNDGFDGEAKNDNEECMKDDKGGLDLKMQNIEDRDGDQHAGELRERPLQDHEDRS